jgi:hypothetical protein
MPYVPSKRGCEYDRSWELNRGTVLTILTNRRIDLKPSLKRDETKRSQSIVEKNGPDGKSRVTVPSEVLMSKSTEFPGSGNISQTLANPLKTLMQL